MPKVKNIYPLNNPKKNGNTRFTSKTLKFLYENQVCMWNRENIKLEINIAVKVSDSNWLIRRPIM